ncbi:hypothetical protein [Sphingomonas sanxanigenens]|uniref:Flagellar assembly protein FliH/Type III secretion system HrpE domain-containing protein n=1 Tax=Sphingomonas sanxanigenens DSM 19645 = NX02 TaxID=1123269 RepID=W0ACN0_9SPHN|nr:hypothetical protein [Sphingomonas sanxanigenens]AHE55649.1 hypothetical protein NX02_19950 [Sphingomonas sanxanigenens DSM 19645 = NX02]
MIKAIDGAAAVARPLAPLRTENKAANAIHAPDPKIAALEEELAQTIRRAEKFVAENENLRAARDRAYADGERAGRIEGRKEAEHSDAKRLAALERAIAAALARRQERSANALDLARVIAFEALGRLLDEDRERADLLSRIIETQVARLERTSILRIEVSREDFPDADAIASIRDQVAESVQIDVLGQAPHGHCRIVQTLGAIDAGIETQFGRLAALLLPEERYDAG